MMLNVCSHGTRRDISPDFASVCGDNEVDIDGQGMGRLQAFGCLRSPGNSWAFD